jgi:hypothetical protein
MFGVLCNVDMGYCAMGNIEIWGVACVVQTGYMYIITGCTFNVTSFIDRRNWLYILRNWFIRA